MESLTLAAALLSLLPLAAATLLAARGPQHTNLRWALLATAVIALGAVAAAGPGGVTQSTPTAQASVYAVALVAACAATFTFFRTLVDQTQN